MTLTACNSSPKVNGGPEVNGSVKIARNVGGSGCEVEYYEYYQPAPEAHKIKSWLSGLELQKTDYPRELDDVWYELEFKQMTVLDDITQLSVYTHENEQFVWYNSELYSVGNPDALPLELTLETLKLFSDGETIDYALITHTKDGKTETHKLSGGKSAELRGRIESLLCERHTFNENDTPLDRYTTAERYKFDFVTKPVCNCYHTVTYIVFGENDGWLGFDGKWYYVQNPPKLPI